MEIKSINSLGKDRYIISYIVPTPCGCSFTRSTLIVNRDKKPTEKQAKKLVEDEIANK